VEWLKVKVLSSCPSTATTTTTKSKLRATGMVQVLESLPSKCVSTDFKSHFQKEKVGKLKQEGLSVQISKHRHLADGDYLSLQLQRISNRTQ
jgi:hypothetical protein